MGMTPTQLIAAQGLVKMSVPVVAPPPDAPPPFNEITSLGPALAYPLSTIEPLREIYSGSDKDHGINLSGGVPNLDDVPYSQVIRKIRSLLGQHLLIITTPDYGTTLTAALNKIMFLDHHIPLAAGIVSGKKIFASPQSFIGHFNLAQGYAATSFDLQGSLEDAGSKGFESFGFGVTKFSEMITGGQVEVDVPGIVKPAFSLLDKLKDPIPADLKSQILAAANFGVGTGPFGNPTLLDIVGSAAGYPYIDSLVKINDVQDRIANSTIGTAFRDLLRDVLEDLHDLSSTYVRGDLDNSITEVIHPVDLNRAISLSTFIDDDLLNIEQPIKSLIVEATAAGLLMQQQASIEPANLAKAIASQGPPSIARLTFEKAATFASRLPEFAIDKKKSGTGLMLERVANSSSVYGEAILACMAEGKNISALQSAGIQPTLETSPDKLAKRLTS